jgi:isoaspartyl peptidase/L-asparaginase-like protein (Ntn-hydrolase superfamily)
MQYLGESVQKAARSVVEALRRDDGAGGVIALDNEGNGKRRTWLLSGTMTYPRDSGNSAELSGYVPWAGTRGRGDEDSHL